MAVVVAAIGVLVRSRIVAGAPLPPPEPALWFLLGMRDDVVIAAAIALLCVQRVITVALLFVVFIGQLAMSEAIVFLGHAVRKDDFVSGFHSLLFRGSAGGGVLLMIVVVSILYALGTAWAIRFARKEGRPGLMAVLAAVVLLGLTWWIAPAPATARNALLTLPELRRVMDLNTAEMHIPQPRLDPRLVRELAGNVDPSTFLSDDYPLARRLPRRSPDAISLPPGVKPNFVFILMESMRAEEVGAYGNDPPGITPNLDRLAAEGIRIDPAYSAGAYTPEGELAVLYSTLASPYGIVERSLPGVRLTGFPDILTANGWRSLLWMHSSDATFYLGGRFYRQHGIPVIDGRDFPQTDPSTGWGFSDRALMRHAIEALDRLPQPFATLVLTVSNHHPFKLPSDAGPPLDVRGGTALQALGRSTRSLLQTMHYADEALGDFFAAARTKPWFANTVFVVCGDHGVAVPAVNRPKTAHVAAELRHRIPLIIYSPLLPHGVTIRGPASQVDILPTLLGAAGIDHPIATPGRDLFDPAQRDDARPVIAYDLPTHAITVAMGRYVYHATDGAHDELLIDNVADPNGTHNLIASQPEIARRCRRAAAIDVDLYTWLVARDRMRAP
jgi:arylsulfatase A-like enzyme